MWNNTYEAVELSKEAREAQPIDKNEEAMKRYKEYEKILQCTKIIDKEYFP
jgi:hypothetical protein